MGCEAPLGMLLVVLPAAWPAAACRSDGVGEPGRDPVETPAGRDRLEDVRLTHEVDGRTVMELTAADVLVETGELAGERAVLRGVSVRFPRGWIAAGGAVLAALTLAAAPGAAAHASAPSTKVVAAPPAAPPAAAPGAAPSAPTRAVAPAAATLAAPDATPMEIEADRLEVDHRAGKAVFSGNVVAVRGETTLRCERIDADYDPEGGLRSVVATGAVALASRKLRATGARATYLEADRTVVIEGGLSVTDGKSSMTGERARIFLDEERFVVDKARGKLVFAPRTGSAAPPRPPARGPKP